MKSDKLGLQ